MQLRSPKGMTLSFPARRGGGGGRNGERVRFLISTLISTPNFRLYIRGVDGRPLYINEVVKMLKARPFDDLSTISFDGFLRPLPKLDNIHFRSRSSRKLDVYLANCLRDERLMRSRFFNLIKLYSSLV